MAEHENICTLENADLWLDDLKERLNAHFERTVEWLEDQGIGWDNRDQYPYGFTMLNLYHVAPEWAWLGFYRLGWPLDLNLTPAIRGGDCMEAEDFAWERIRPDFRDFYPLGGCSGDELAEAEVGGADPVPPFPELPY